MAAKTFIFPTIDCQRTFERVAKLPPFRYTNPKGEHGRDTCPLISI
jgi:hypothetical protein